MASSNPKLPKDAVWFVTGTSSGIGYSLISSILSTPGHRIVVLSRNPSAISLPSTSNNSNTLLQPIDLSSSASIASAFKAAIDKFGRVDVVVNNAGYSLKPTEFESIDGKVSPELFEVNYWAPVEITRHAMGIMRDVNPKTGSIGGVIAQISSAGGYQGVAGIAPYNASKFALEGFTEAVSKEVDPDWNIRFAIIEPGGVKTKWASGNMVGDFKQHEAYVGKNLQTEMTRMVEELGATQFWADPDAVAVLISDVLKGEKGVWDGKEVLRLPVGADSWALVMAETIEQKKRFGQWREISESTSTREVKGALIELGYLKNVD
jgi:NAD(P)-dependent dehydrogenase (short-subunit alcohol dehydrogenase family)